MDTADRILDSLLSGVHYAVRKLVMQRFEAMHRELAFRWKQAEGDAAFLRSVGYTDEHVRALCALNSSSCADRLARQTPKRCGARLDVCRPA